ncbi:MAG: CHAT domain-containing protein [Ardenticatenaceae bacterium]|nr:CHAT domain-containing protein [Ardenticatenaceae bacterium]
MPTVQDLLDAHEARVRALLACLTPEDTATLLRQIKQEIDSGRAVPNAPRLVALAEKAAAQHPDHPEFAALAAWIAGNAATIANECESALVAYARATAAFRAVGDEYSVACLRVGEMVARVRLGQRSDARAVAREIAPVLRAHNDQLRLATLAGNLGVLAIEEQRPATALRYYTRAARRYRALGRPSDVARMLLDSAYALIELDDFRRARRRLLAARRAFEAEGVAAYVSLVEQDLGVLEARRGRYDRALRHLHAARAGFEALGQSTDAAVAEADLARVYLALNCADEVVAHSETLRARLQGFDRHTLTLDLIAAHRARGDGHTAAQLLARLRGELGDDPALSGWHAQVALEAATLALDAGQPADALREGQQAARILRAQRRAVPGVLADLMTAAASMELGRPADAAPLIARAGAEAQRLSRPLAWRAAALAARLAHLEGRLAEAAAFLERAIGIVETLRGTVPLDEWRASFLDDKLSLYTERAALAQAEGDAVEAWAWAERARGRALVELLASAPQPTTSSAGGHRQRDREVVRLEEEIHWLEQRLADAQWGVAAPARQQHTERRLAEAYRRLRLIEGEAAAKPVQPGLNEPHTSPLAASVDLAAVRSALAPDEALVEFMVTGREERLSAFVVTRDTLHTVGDLGVLPDLWETLAELLRFDLDDFRAAPPAAWADPGWQARTVAHLQTLYEALLAPLAPWLERARRVVVVPTGQLFYVPFHALHDGARFVADRWELRYAPSAHSVRLCAERAQSQPGSGTPLVAGVAAAGGLPHVYEEVAAVAEALPGARCLLDEAATLEALRTAAPDVTVLHLAAHAEFRADNPLFSSVLLGAGRRLHVYAIGRLQLRRAHLVTLSACETGMSAVQGGDLLGLAHGFFAAGAPALVVSLWPVLDAATAPLMTAFYRRLVANEGKAAALRAAQAEIREHFPHPYLWAPFVLLGDASPFARRGDPR